MGWTTCLNSDCIKSNECERFLQPMGTEIDFKHICPNSPIIPYKYFWQSEQSIAVKDEINAIKPNIEGGEDI